MEGGESVGFTSLEGVCTSAMTMDDAPHICQADAGALEFMGVMQTLKDAKQLVHVAHIKANAIVTHKDNIFFCAAVGADVDARRITGSGIFYGVGNEILQDLM